MDRSFRIGPIRPPSEADSLLLQVTSGCTWNKCKFCQLYRGTKFQAYSADSIKADIDNMVYHADKVKQYQNTDGSWDIEGINAELISTPVNDTEAFYMIANWLIKGGENVFLQDGNTTALSSGRLTDVLRYLREAFPNIKRVTSYGRAENLAKTSIEEYAQLKEAGLDRIHSGYESGSDVVLKKINKGVTQEEEIRAGENIKAGGIELSIYFMPGVGGKELTIENAIGTSEVLNSVDPDFLRIRTAAVKPGTGLYEDFVNGEFTLCSDDEKLIEIRTVIERAEGIETTVVSDHILNLLQGIEGHMINDKPRLLALIDEYLQMPQEERKIYQMARRTLRAAEPKDIYRFSEGQLNEFRNHIKKFPDSYEWEKEINDLIGRYI